jgi:hypothetical protein
MKASSVSCSLSSVEVRSDERPHYSRMVKGRKGWYQLNLRSEI